MYCKVFIPIPVSLVPHCELMIVEQKTGHWCVCCFLDYLILYTDSYSDTAITPAVKALGMESVFIANLIKPTLLNEKQRTT